ncbi:MAG: trypsin-like serine protease [Candidatus Planktophila sp.]
MRFKILIILMGLICGLAPSSPAHAVYGGVQVTGTPLVLTLLTSKSARTSFCSMALLTERIVVTAAHCVIQDQGVAPNLRWNIADIYVSQPGADVTNDDISSRVHVEKIITRDDFINTWKPEIKDYRTQINDIAFLFLEKPLVKGYSIEIATDREIDLALAKGEMVTHYGYGLQSPSTQSHSPWMTQLQLVDKSDEHLDKSKVVYSKEGPTAMCPGDSGGPWYLDIGGVTKIAAVLVAASGCRGNLPYNGGTLGTRIAPYMELANSKWDEFIKNEESINAGEIIRAEQHEKVRKQAIADGTYLSPGGCHVSGISAELQSQDLNGNWNAISSPMGWIASDVSCPKTHTSQPWAIATVTEGTKLRWKFWSGTWQVYGESFTWRNTVSVETKPAVIDKPIGKALKVTIVCTKGKLVKKITALKPKCPSGWKIQR